MKIQLILLFIFLASCSSGSWRDASRESTGIAPKPESLSEDIVIIYYARAFSWRGYFGVHPWIAWKEKDEETYTVAQVTSWQLRGGKSSVSVIKDLPDRRWFDSAPTELIHLRGDRATSTIAQLKDLISTYPFSDRYSVWPGPNSNTFVAYMIRNIPELDIKLPAHAVGKDYLGPNQFFANTASETGFKFSAFGLFGLSLGLAEGAEVNLLGLHFGLDLWTPAISLPIVGRLGFKDKSF